MTTNAWRAQFDKLARDTFARHGMAEKPTEAEPTRVTYTQAGSSTPVPCAVYFDREVFTVGIDESQVVAAELVITAFRDQIGGADPVRGARFDIAGTVYRIDAVIDGDESRVRVLVKKGA